MRWACRSCVFLCNGRALPPALCCVQPTHAPLGDAAGHLDRRDELEQQDGHEHGHLDGAQAAGLDSQEDVGFPAQHSTAQHSTAQHGTGVGQQLGRSIGWEGKERRRSAQRALSPVPQRTGSGSTAAACDWPWLAERRSSKTPKRCRPPQMTALQHRCVRRRGGLKARGRFRAMGAARESLLPFARQHTPAPATSSAGFGHWMSATRTSQPPSKLPLSSLVELSCGEACGRCEGTWAGLEARVAARGAGGTGLRGTGVVRHRPRRTLLASPRAPARTRRDHSAMAQMCAQPRSACGRSAMSMKSGCRTATGRQGAGDGGGSSCRCAHTAAGAAGVCEGRRQAGRASRPCPGRQGRATVTCC